MDDEEAPPAPTEVVKLNCGVLKERRGEHSEVAHVVSVGEDGNEWGKLRAVQYGIMETERVQKEGVFRKEEKASVRRTKRRKSRRMMQR